MRSTDRSIFLYKLLTLSLTTKKAVFVLVSQLSNVAMGAQFFQRTKDPVLEILQPLLGKSFLHTKYPEGQQFHLPIFFDPMLNKHQSFASHSAVSLKSNKHHVPYKQFPYR